MAIPDYETLMRPILAILSDGKEHTVRELNQLLAEEFQLTDAELRQTLRSSPQSLFRNRVAWSLAYLKRALVIEAIRRATYRITDRGSQLLARMPGRISKDDLRQFPEMEEFLRPRRTGHSVEPIFRRADGLDEKRQPDDLTDNPERATPEELIAIGHNVLTRQLATDLLGRVKSETPEFFESLVIDLLLALGYGGSREDAAQIVGGSGDGGIDGIIKEDKLGLDTIYVQAKRWEGVVGRPELQKFAGALQGKRARKGVFITTSGFTREATEYVEAIDSKIILINGDDLARLMINHNVGVSVKQIYSVKHIDQDYFTED